MICIGEKMCDVFDFNRFGLTATLLWCIESRAETISRSINMSRDRNWNSNNSNNRLITWVKNCRVRCVYLLVSFSDGEQIILEFETSEDITFDSLTPNWSQVTTRPFKLRSASILQQQSRIIISTTHKKNLDTHTKDDEQKTDDIVLKQKKKDWSPAKQRPRNWF